MWAEKKKKNGILPNTISFLLFLSELPWLYSEASDGRSFWQKQQFFHLWIGCCPKGILNRLVQKISIDKEILQEEGEYFSTFLGFGTQGWDKNVEKKSL